MSVSRVALILTSTLPSRSNALITASSSFNASTSSPTTTSFTLLTPCDPTAPATSQTLSLAQVNPSARTPASSAPNRSVNPLYPPSTKLLTPPPILPLSPDSTSLASSSVTACPRETSSYAACKPVAPAPMMQIGVVMWGVVGGGKEKGSGSGTECVHTGGARPFVVRYGSSLGG